MGGWRDFVPSVTGDEMGCGIKFKANEGEERPQPNQAVQVFFTRFVQEVNSLNFMEGIWEGWEMVRN